MLHAAVMPPQRLVLRITAAAALAAGLAGAAYLGSPYVAVYQIQRAIEQRDAARLSHYVDYGAVRAHLKATLAAQVSARTAGRSDPIAAAVGALGAQLGNAMIETLVTPVGLAAALYGREAVVGRPPTGATPGAAAPGAAPRPSAHTAFGYQGLDAFEIRRAHPDRPSQPTVIRLERRGLAHWKIVAIDLPAGLLLPR